MAQLERLRFWVRTTWLHTFQSYNAVKNGHVTDIKILFCGHE